MTLAEIRETTRDIIKELETDTGALFPSDNARLDRYINFATEDVVLDLVEFIPECFLDYEDITLVANQSDYDLTAEFLQIWTMNRNIADKAPRPIQYIDIRDQAYEMYVGQTAESPDAWTFKGDTIIFIPTPSAAKTAYARCWIVATEAASMAVSGPVYIPRMAHKLIPLYTGALIAETVESDKMNSMMLFYQKRLKKVTDVIGFRVQQQPRFLGTSFHERRMVSTLDPALYDLGSPFED